LLSLFFLAYAGTVSDTEALIEVKKTGICGSDVHYLVHGRIGDFILNNPMVLGHESAGIVSKVGSKVKHIKPGDRVAIEPGAACRVCEACKSGRYELCADMVFAATPPYAILFRFNQSTSSLDSRYDGTLGRFYRVPADLAYPLPDHLSLEDGAMVC
jgi:D-xylulose reductase